MLRDSGRVEYRAVTDREALDAFALLSRREGIIPALESSHALAQLARMKGEFARGDIVVVNLSGRGDKDLAEVARLTGGAG
jgi:tryptophan synthase beta chain